MALQYTDEQHLQMLKERSGMRTAQLRETEAEEMPENIRRWLANLANLYGVPFENLVANETMLPQESIRFFYINENWISALLDGAMSISIHHSRDQEVQSGNAYTAYRQVQVERRMVRRRVVGAASPAELEVGFIASGFLMRSSLVFGWPGIEVRAYEDEEGEQPPIELLRMDRLAPDVLLCMFSKIPKLVTISEPKEGLAFGTGDDNLIMPRFLGGNAEQPVGKSAAPKDPAEYVKASFRTFDGEVSRVLDVTKTKDDLVAKLNTLGVVMPPGIFSSATFAIQMVKTAAEQSFVHSEGNLSHVKPTTQT